MFADPKDRQSLMEYIEAQLEECGYQFISNKDFRLGNSMFPSYSKNISIGKNMFGYDRKAHLLLHHPDKWPGGLVIEARWQSENGTTYQKFPFFVANINASSYKNIFVLGGQAAMPGSVDWLRSQVNEDRFVQLLTPQEFGRWADDGII